MFYSVRDQQVERDAAAEVGAAWGCDLRSFGSMALIDWYASRDRQLLAVLELKARKHAWATFPTVFLSMRKWLSMSLVSAGMNVHAIFVVRFADQIRWTSIAAVDARRVRIGGHNEPRAANDIEPLIDVPIEMMWPLHERPWD